MITIIPSVANVGLPILFSRKNTGSPISSRIRVDVRAASSFPFRMVKEESAVVYSGVRQSCPRS